MVFDVSEMQVFIRPGFTDLRKSINSLSILVEQEMELDLFSKSLFLFCSRDKKLIKMLYWDRNGFCLWQKRLEKHRFPWPITGAEAREITRQELLMLFDGIDFWNAHTSLPYSRVS